MLLESVDNFDFKNPDYVAVFKERARRLSFIRQNPHALPALKAFYKANIGKFIDDWGMTFDPRNADVGLPTVVPFRLFPRQFEWVDWYIDRWRKREDGLTEKSRDMGVSWLALSTAASIGLFYSNIVIGFGSRDEDSVDLNGSPDCLFWKARFFLKYLPQEFRGDWDEQKDSAHMRIRLPSGSTITGDAGKNIGRGGRASIYVIDEAAHLQNPVAAEAALSQTTNCRIYVSSVNGRANPFAQKRFSGKVPVFTFHWKQDPRKDQAWYEAQCDKLDPITVAQEIDINYDASAEGILIPVEWVRAAKGAHKLLGIVPSGRKIASLDIADEGHDKNASAHAHGPLVQRCKEWSGKGSDIFETVVRAANWADEWEVEKVYYDADGLGAGARGDARVMNGERKKAGKGEIAFEPFRGSGEVFEPDKTIPTAQIEKTRDRKDRTNKDFFSNAKAQAWWNLRVRFQRTFRAVNLHHEGKPNPYKPDDMIFLDEAIEDIDGLIAELSQPTYSINTVGKVVVDKAPDGTKSPNKADSVMILFAPRRIGYLNLV